MLFTLNSSKSFHTVPHSISGTDEVQTRQVESEVD